MSRSSDHKSTPPSDPPAGAGRQLSGYLRQRDHWHNVVYAAAGGYGLALAWWSWQNRSGLAGFVLDNAAPAGGAPGLLMLSGGALAALAIWLLLGSAAARLSRLSLAATLDRLSALWLAAALLAFLPLLALEGIETAHVWLTYCLVAAMALVAFLAAREFQASRIRERGPLAQPSSSHRWVGPALVVALGIAYAVFMAALTLARHASFQTHAFDLAIQDQAFATILSRGYPLVTLYGDQAVNQFGDHFTPIYYLLAPAYALVGDARALLVIQALFLGLAAIPVYLLARRLAPAGGALLAAALAFSFLLHPALHGVNTFDFHEIALAPFLLLWALWCLESGRHRLMVVFLVLAALTKEEVALTTAAIGLYLLIFRGQTRLGGWITGLSLAYFGVVNFVVMPALGGGPDLTRFAGLADTNSGASGLLALLGGILGNPVHAFSYALLDGDKLAFLALLFLPVVFSPLWARARWLTALPAFAVALFSVVPSQYSIDYHYPAIMLPFVFYLAAAGLSRMAVHSGPDLRSFAAARPAALAAAIVVASLAMNWQYGWLLGKRFQPPPQVDQRRQAVAALLDELPPRASVSVTSDLAPHVSSREQVYLFPIVAGADTILFDSNRDANFWPFTSIDPRGEAIANLLPYIQSGDYGLVDEESGVLLLRRGGDTAANPHALSTLLSTTYPAGDLPSADGVREVADPQAGSGVAKVNAGKPAGQDGDVGLVFGPYAELQPGRYRVTYRLKLDESGLAGRVATVDVFSFAAGGALVSRDLDASEFSAPGQYQEFSVEMELSEPLDSVEYRVLHSGLGTLSVDTIQVTYLGEPGS